MKIYLQDKKTIIENPDTGKGKLIPETIHVHNDEVPFIADEGHYEVVKEYENGGKEMTFVIEKKGQEFKPSQEYDEDILIYIPYTQEELEQNELLLLRMQRETECFSIINRGQPWYDKLTEEQKTELNTWYQAWLEVTETMVAPEKPKWI